MKKNVVLTLFVIVCFILIGSCAIIDINKSKHTINVFNEYLPDEETTLIAFYIYGLSIVEYNGIQVNWISKPFTRFQNTATVELLRIPGGNTQFVFNGEHLTHVSKSTFNMISFNFNFENGKEYTVNVDWDGKAQIYSGLFNHVLFITHDYQRFLIATVDMLTGRVTYP
ncbi:MAG: hypothetical protein FWD28_03945 [Treponema sp.]|nr:hypothetical protein [Treponema sp.]